MGVVISHETFEAARTARRDRAGARDLAVLAACCCWPLTLSWFFGLAAVEAAAGVWGRR